MSLIKRINFKTHRNAKQCMKFEIKKGLLVLPVNHFFYWTSALCLQEAFEANGVNLLIVVDPESNDFYKTILDTIEPQFCISINGYSNELFQELDIFHIRWVQDYQFGKHNFRDKIDCIPSDICYGLFPSHLEDIYTLDVKYRSILPFATRSRAHEQALSFSRKWALVGFIPEYGILDQKHITFDNRRITGKDFIRFYIDRYSGNLYDISSQTIDFIAKDFIAINKIDLKNDINKFFFKEDYVRLLNRFHVAESLVGSGLSGNLFGETSWLSYPSLKKYYSGKIIGQNSLINLFRGSELNIHNGGNMWHPRAFDVMGSNGGVLLANDMATSQGDYSYNEGEHYLSCNGMTFGDLALFASKRPELCKKISRNAYHHTQAHHTWHIRVKKILNDIKQVKGM